MTTTTSTSKAQPGTPCVPTAQERRDAIASERHAARYTQVLNFCTLHGILLSPREDWRWIDGTPTGTINGLPVHGTLYITNGVLAYMLLDDATLFLCHFDFFIRDRAPRPTGNAQAARATPQRLTQLMERYGI